MSADISKKFDAIERLSAEPIEPNISELVRLLEDRNWSVRERALDALWTAGANDTTFAPLARLAARACLQDSAACVRDTAAEALGEIGTRADIARMVNCLRDPAWMVRCSAAGSLGQLRAHRKISTLMETLRYDPNPSVRRYAAVSLAVLGGDVSREALLHAEATERSSAARTGILIGLYTLGDSDRMRDLLALLSDTDSQVRHQVLSCVAHYARASEVAGVSAAIAQLLETEENNAVRSEAETTLTMLRERSAS